MKNLILIVLLSVAATSQIKAETEREFITHIIDVLPKASPGEFKTPDSVASYFVQAIIENHLQETFRCVPLSQMFAIDTFENRVRYVGNYYNASKDTLPDDDYGRYLKLLTEFHYFPVEKCRIALLLANDQFRTNMTEKLGHPESQDPSVINKWLEKLSKDLSFQNLAKATITSVNSKSKHTELKHLGVLPFKDITEVTIHVSIQSSDIPITFLVGSVDGNYQISSLVDR
jgi:hypothetical protein